MWVPSLMLVNGGSVPTGLVFSAFMLSMTFGGLVFGLLLPWFPGGVEGVAVLIYFLSAVAMAIPVFAFDFWHILGAFLLLETMFGMFNSCGPLLRSKYYPEGIQSSIMSTFRLPLNILVVIGTKLADYAQDEHGYKFVFGIIVCIHLVACTLQIVLNTLKHGHSHVKQD
jgi:MFS family permease